MRHASAGEAQAAGAPPFRPARRRRRSAPSVLVSKGLAGGAATSAQRLGGSARRRAPSWRGDRARLLRGAHDERRLTADQTLDEFRAAGALLDGHFILSSGLHSPVFLQKMFVFQDPARTERLCRALAREGARGLRADRRRRLARGRRHRAGLRDGALARRQGDLRRARGRRLQAASRLRDCARRARADGRGHHHHRPLVARDASRRSPSIRERSSAPPA